MNLLLAVILLALGSLVASAHAGPYTPRFQAAACPRTPEPIAALAKARCGFLIVPENRSIPRGRLVRLAVAIVPPAEKAVPSEPVVFMAGGPGEAAILDAPFLVDAGINKRHELVIMDQRGTLYDDPDLNCPELDRFYARQVSLVYDAPSTGRAQAAAGAACRRRLEKRGVDLSSYNTTENEADFVDLRRALGITQWDVYGYSYGTDLALSLMRDHPEGIRTAVIDSVVPPDAVGLTWTWGSARTGITAIFNQCQAQPACRRKFPDLLPKLTRLVIGLEKRPIVRNVVPARGGRAVKVVLDGGTLVNMLVGNAPKPPDVPRAITELANGNPRLILQTRAAAAHVAAVPEQALGMTQSFVCREWEPYGPPAAILRAGRHAFPSWPAPVLINAPQMPFQRELCRVWNVPRGPASQRVRVRSRIPTLVVSGVIDAKTGWEWGRYVARDLPNSRYVKIKNLNHWVIVRSRCAQQIFQSFLAHPLSPNTACAAAVPPVEFNV